MGSPTVTRESRKILGMQTRTRSSYHGDPWEAVYTEYPPNKSSHKYSIVFFLMDEEQVAVHDDAFL
jgi:hypothetical protein